MTIERLTKEEVMAIHSIQLAWYGGGPGLRDEALLDIALAPLPNIDTGETPRTPSLATLAAAYATGIASNRPFLDGNRRTALIAALTFIERNGFSVTASQEDAYAALYNLAIGFPSEDELAKWLEANIEPVSK